MAMQEPLVKNLTPYFNLSARIFLKEQDILSTYIQFLCFHHLYCTWAKKAAFLLPVFRHVTLAILSHIKLRDKIVLSLKLQVWHWSYDHAINRYDSPSFLMPKISTKFQGGNHNGAPQKGVIGYNRRFSTDISLYLRQKVQDRYTVIMEC